MYTRAQLAKFIDYAILRPEADRAQLAVVCREAAHYGFATVCVFPYWVSLAAVELAGTDVKVCSAVGFPFGAHLTAVKVLETKTSIQDGAGEVDVVINIGALKTGAAGVVLEDIQSVVKTAKFTSKEIVVKAIIETCYLTQEEKVKACSIAKSAGTDFVKTSTGFGPGGATAEDVKLIREVVGPQMGIKAAGGIKTLEDALRLIEAGATRIGTSNAVEIIESLSE